MEFFSLFNAILSFVIVLYGDPSLQRKIVDMTIEFIQHFISDVFCKSLEASIFKIIDTPESASEMKIKIHECIKLHSNIFEKFSTEKKRFQLLTGKRFEEPQEFEVTKSFTEIIKENKTVFVESPVYGYYIPLTHSLKYFLEISGLASKIIDNIEQLSIESDIVSNVMQAKFWKKNIKSNVPNEFILPLFVYYDDLEVENPLGSHSGKNKFGVVYVSIACLPAYLASLLDSIIFAMIMRSEDMKKCTNKFIFRNLISELNLLRNTGIKVMVDNVLVNFKFQTVLLLGDNS